MRHKLTGEEREQALAKIGDWQMASDRDAISRHFTFKDFNQAFTFMTRIALVAEKMDHHPEWCNVYNTLTVTLSTHDAGGLSLADIQLAKVMDEFYRDRAA